MTINNNRRGLVVPASEDQGATSWGDIGGTLGDQTDLQSSLSDKLSKASGGVVDDDVTVNGSFEAGNGGFTVEGRSSGFNNTNPQVWSTEIDSISLGPKSYLAVDNIRGTIFFSNNLFFDGTDWRYKVDGRGSNIRFKDDGFTIRYATSGIAGDIATLSDLSELSLAQAAYMGDSLAKAGSDVGTEVFLTSGSFVDQAPSSTDTPITINFGVSPITNGLVDYDGLGTFTCTTAGSYQFNLSYQYGRDGASGTSFLFGGVLLNGVPQLVSRVGKLSNSNEDFPVYVPINLTLSVGDEVTFDIWRGSEGNNSGGLQAFIPNLAGKPSVPSAFISLTRLKIL